MRRELIESYYEEARVEKISWIWSRDVFSGSRNSSLHRNTGTRPQRCREGDVAGVGQDYFSEKYNGGNCGKRNVYPGIPGLWKTGVWERQPYLKNKNVTA